MSAPLPGVSEPVLPSCLRCFAPLMVANRSTVAHIEERRRADGWGRPLVGWCECALFENHLVHDHALHGHRGAHLGKEVRRHCDLDVRTQGRLHAQALELEDGWNAVPHVHFDREGDRDLRASVLHALPARVGHPGHVDEQVVGSEPDVVVDAALALGEIVQDRADAERREDVRRNLETELAPDVPGLRVSRFPR